MWPVGMVSDVSCLVSKTFVTGTPPSAPPKRTETARLSCSHIFLYNIVANVTVNLPNNTLQLIYICLRVQAARVLFKVIPSSQKGRFVQDVWLVVLPWCLAAAVPKMTRGNLRYEQDAALLPSFTLCDSHAAPLSASLWPYGNQFLAA